MPNGPATPLYPKELKTGPPINAPSSTSHISQEAETIHECIHSGGDKLIAVYTDKEILLATERNEVRTPAPSWVSLENRQSKKPGTKGCPLLDSTHMTNPEQATSQTGSGFVVARAWRHTWGTRSNRSVGMGFHLGDEYTLDLDSGGG